MSDLISRQAALDAIIGMIDRFERILADIRESKGDDSVCGMCEYDGAYMGQSGDWCNECPGFDKDDCFKLSDRCRKRWMGDIVLLSVQPDLSGYSDKLWRNAYERGKAEAQDARWIPVSERLPDVGREIIFCDVDGDIFVGHRAREHWWSVDDKVKNVVAWMPLPASYKGE